MLKRGFRKSKAISGWGHDGDGVLGIALPAGAAMGLSGFVWVAVAASAGEGLPAQGWYDG